MRPAGLRSLQADGTTAEVNKSERANLLNLTEAKGSSPAFYVQAVVISGDGEQHGAQLTDALVRSGYNTTVLPRKAPWHLQRRNR